MSLGPLYKKFSVDVNDPTEGMMASQMGVRRGIQDAIGGIQSILDRQDEQAKKHNTRLATQELKQRIQEGGLGADPIDINELGQGYYDLVDYDILENVQERQTNLLKTNALDNAASTAATVYDNSNDLIKSSQAFKDSLIAAGMGDTAANKEMSIWRQNNQYRKEDLQHTKDKNFNIGKVNLIEALSNDPTLERQSAIDQVVSNLPAEDRENARQQYRNFFNEREKLTPMQQRNLDSEQKRQVSDLTAFDQEHALSIQQLQSKLTDDPINDKAIAAASQHSNELGGLYKKIDEEIEGGITSGVINAVTNALGGKWNQETGSKAANTFATKTRDLLKNNPDLTRDEVMAIGLQAYQNDYTSHKATIGLGIDPEVFETELNRLANQVRLNKKAKSDIQIAQQEYQTKRKKMVNNQRKRLDKYTEDLHKYNIRGGDKVVFPLDEFKEKILNIDKKGSDTDDSDKKEDAYTTLKKQSDSELLSAEFSQTDQILDAKNAAEQRQINQSRLQGVSAKEQYNILRNKQNKGQVLTRSEQRQLRDIMLAAVPGSPMSPYEADGVTPKSNITIGDIGEALSNAPRNIGVTADKFIRTILGQ